MQQPETPMDRTAVTPTRRTNVRRAIAVSVMFHALLIGVLLLWYIPTRKPSNEDRTLTSTASAEMGDEASVNPPASPPPAPEPNPRIASEQIEASIESQIKAVESLSDERKLSELENYLSRLEAIATEDSVQDVTATIADSLGLDPGPEAATVAPKGIFDHETAQILEVTRERDEHGNWSYTSVLVDAQGRTQSVPLSEAEGESAYLTFEQLKRYPMAEGIYRQLVMPMIQKMIQAGELREQAASEVERMQRDATELSGELGVPSEN